MLEHHDCEMAKTFDTDTPFSNFTEPEKPINTPNLQVIFVHNFFPSIRDKVLLKQNNYLMYTKFIFKVA